MKRRIYILGILILILLLGVGSCRKVGIWLVKDDMPVHADVMVLLTGTIADRVLEMDDLYSEKVAGKIWMVQDNLGPQSELEKRGVKLMPVSMQSRNAMIGLGIPSDSIHVLSGRAASTQMEAVIIRDFLQAQSGIDTLLLVTSSSHTRRAYHIFKTAFKSLENPPVLLCSASRYTEFHAERWWKSKEDIQDVVYESVKMAGFLLFDKRKLKKSE
jgi:uncharacterized SAM-binding protein YcdF (DUF218 family)